MPVCVCRVISFATLGALSNLESIPRSIFFREARAFCFSLSDEKLSNQSNKRAVLFLISLAKILADTDLEELKTKGTDM